MAVGMKWRGATHRIVPALLVVALGFGTLSRGQTPPAASTPPPTKLAVVNIVNLFDALDEKTAAETRVDQMRRTLEKESQTMQQEVDQLSKEVDNPVVFKKGSPEHKKLQDELLEKTTRWKVHDEMAQAKLTLELRSIPLDIYRKMSDAIRDYSAANGIALVFVADDTNSLSSARTQQELMAMITMRKVVYFHPTFDITPSIIAKMNTQYKLGADKKP